MARSKKSLKQPAAGHDPAAASPRQKLLLVAFGVGFSLLALALVEGALSLFGIGDSRLYEDPFVGFEPGSDLFSERTLPDGQTVYATNPNKLAFFNYQAFPVEKPPGSYRIFSLGGSTTAGRPYDDRVAFSHWLQLYLDEMDPSRTWEVINAGAISYASYRIVVLMKELIRYEPDLFVVYTGHNEFLEERSYSDIIHQRPALKRFRRWLNGLRFYTLARHGWQQLRQRPQSMPGTLESEVTTKLDGWTGLELYHRDEELASSVVEHFAYNLHQIVAIARRSGADIVFIKPASNLKDFSPFKSEHSPGLGPEEVRLFEQLSTQGRSLLEAGDPRAALGIFEEALELDPDYADLHFRIGRCHLALGEHAEAHRAFIRAKDLDVAPLRALEPIAESVAEVAGLYGLALIDLSARLQAESQARFGHPILGNEFFLDHVHPDLPVHSLIAERLAQVLLDQGVAHRQPAWSEARRKAIYDRHLASLDRRYFAQRDLNLAKVLGWAGKLEEAEPALLRAAEVLGDEPEVHLNLGIIYERTGRLPAALDELSRALALEPDSAVTLFNLGVVYGHLDRLGEGIAALEEAIRLQPQYAEAHHNLGVLYRRRGELDRAAASLHRALELRRDAPEVYRSLGRVYGQQGRLEEAVAALLRSIELNPVDSVTRTDLGLAYARQERFDDAIRELEEAIRIDPTNVEAQFNLGVALAQSGKPEAAAAAYRQTLEVDPRHAPAHNNLGIFLAGQGKLEDASRELVLAIESDPGYAEAYFNLGIVYDNAGVADGALRAIERALQLEPDNARFHYGLATLLEARGEMESARSHFEQAEKHREKSSRAPQGTSARQQG